MKYIYHIIFALLLLSSCTEEHNLYNTVHRLDISFADDKSRSTWDDKTDSEDKVVYVWENNTNMLTAIKHAGQYVPFYTSMTSEAQYYSETQFETVDAANSHIKLHTTRGVKYDVNAGEYVYPVAAGDEMYCCHPINAHTTINSSVSDLYVDMHLPSTFTYDNLSNDLSSLAEYSYVYTSTSINSVHDAAVVANTSAFNSACAIIRFNITNNITSDIIITGVKMETDDGSTLFPNVLRFADRSVAEQSDKSSYYNRLTTEISSVTIPRSKKGVFYNMCFPLDGDFNSVPLVFTIDTNYLTYRLKLDSDVITNHKFEAGKIYTFNFSLEEKAVNLNMIDIDQCTTYNSDNTESLNVIVSPNAVWDQSDHETAQMVFVSLNMTTIIDGTEYEVLWASCNLGAMEASEEGDQYAWGEVTTKDPSQYTPGGYNSSASTDIFGTEYDAVRSYLGNGHWIWRTPTLEMWRALMDKCEWKWKNVSISVDGPSTEENLNFDASVWAVTRRNDLGEIVGQIYLPITGYTGYNTSTGTYEQVKKALCYYWTSTPCSNVPGATEKSWAFKTTYSTEVGTGIGHMSDPAIVECERYNGFSIRPVLLKEK